MLQFKPELVKKIQGLNFPSCTYVASDHEHKEEIAAPPRTGCLSHLPLLPQADSGLGAFTTYLVMGMRDNQANL